MLWPTFALLCDCIANLLAVWYCQTWNKISGVLHVEWKVHKVLTVSAQRGYVVLLGYLASVNSKRLFKTHTVKHVVHYIWMDINVRRMVCRMFNAFAHSQLCVVQIVLLLFRAYNVKLHLKSMLNRGNRRKVAPKLVEQIILDLYQLKQYHLTEHLL